ncbi:hypothetical protein [Mesorhizobium sp.]|uniref:hypothetical protein n=1 Tax=Mesorhizobium sp. TaxID=1871066 RepID=UPI001219EA1D|nr:hypothetical protein [Mesorhizobium sp.]TIU80261.1 MAG: hypothetical protein E5W13_03945 [Mesorhizobium sp.]TIX81666.1 MAG: hypothetical protein E5V21_10100 [Mesorhizobium sp.]
MHNSVCLDFDGGSSSKARLDTRITKVGQTNIDELLMDFFWHRVNFFAFAARPTGRRKLGCAGNPIMDLAPNPGQRRLLKKSHDAGNNFGIRAFWVSSAVHESNPRKG